MQLRNESEQELDSMAMKLLHQGATTWGSAEGRGTGGPVAAPFFRPFITLEGALAQSVPEGFLLRDLSDQSLLLPWECLGTKREKTKCICVNYVISTSSGVGKAWIRS